MKAIESRPSDLISFGEDKRVNTWQLSYVEFPVPMRNLNFMRRTMFQRKAYSLNRSLPQLVKEGAGVRINQVSQRALTKVRGSAKGNA